MLGDIESCVIEKLDRDADDNPRTPTWYYKLGIRRDLEEGDLGGGTMVMSRQYPSYDDALEGLNLNINRHVQENAFKFGSLRSSGTA